MKKKFATDTILDSFKTRSFRVGGYSIVAIAIVLAIVIALNLFVSALPVSWMQYDITANNMFSISDQTETLIKNLNKDVTIYWIVTAGQEDPRVENMLNRVDDLSDRITVVRKDTTINPTFAEKYTQEMVYDNSLVVECGERARFLDASKDIFKDAIIFNGHIYKIFREMLSWDEAKAYCERIGGHLATVTSAEEDAALYSYLARNGGQNCYLGGTDAQTEGVWKWVTGERWDYANWEKTEPNGKNAQNWLGYYYTYENGKWDDISGKRWFMCEWDYACIRADGGIGSHSFGETEVISEATCDEYGFGVHSCSDCGFSEWIQTDKNEHSFGEWEDVVKASCTLDGEQKRTCEVCGREELQTSPAISHNFSEWREVSGNKFLPPIVSERVCSHCGEIETQKDMSTWWITPAIVAGVIVAIIGVVGYIKAYK